MTAFPNATQQAALAYIRAGLSILPTGKDKIPVIKSWKSRMVTIPAESTIRTDFKNGACLAIVGGQVSGNVECLDFDFEGRLFTAWMNLVDNDAPGLVDRLVIQETQNGGFHAAYRCEEPVGGSKKLSEDEIEVIGPGEHEYQGKKFKAVERNGKYYIAPCYIETKGEGGYFLCYPSNGYNLQQGKFSQLPTITAGERNILISAAKSLNRWIPVPRQGPAANKRQDGELWRRPGKSKGWSGTLFNSGSLYVFSSNSSPFESDTSYSPLAIYTLLEHAGDYGAAVRDLAAQGYGEPRERPAASSTEKPEAEPKQSPCSLSMSELCAKEFPPIQWLLPDILPIGSTLLAGPPKLGKSVMVLNLAVAVTTDGAVYGGYTCGTGEVIYLALETT